MRAEDLATGDTKANQTLHRLFHFLLTPANLKPANRPPTHPPTPPLASAGDIGTVVGSVAGRVLGPPLPALVWAALQAAAKSEVAGGSQRAHLVKLLLRKPAKCMHLSRVQAALGYTPLQCATRIKGREGSREGTAEAGGEVHTQRRRRRSRRRRV